MTAISRRNLLLGGAASLGRTAHAADSTSPTGGLKALAAERGILYGSYINLFDPNLGGPYRIIAAHECGLCVSSQMDWPAVEPERGQNYFTKVDSDYAWAHAHDMQFQGHCLVWGEMTPHWFNDLPDRAAEAALRRHAAVMCRHFAGRMHSWIVVNEALLIWAGRPDKLRPHAFLDKIGPEYIDISFNVARENDPKARLVYNDFGVEVDKPDQNAKRAALLDLLDGLKKRNIPVDTLGLQSHLYYELMPAFNDKLFGDFLREVAARGLEIMITELDVIDKGAPSDIAKRDAEVAAIYKRYLDVALDNPALRTVITWGLTDRATWILERHDDPATIRSDGLKPRPLVFDANYVPKPAYFAVAEAFRAAPKR